MLFDVVNECCHGDNRSPSYINKYDHQRNIACCPSNTLM